MVKTHPALIASLRHYIALYQGNILPLPGTKRYVGRENPHSLFYSSLFTKSSETPINTGVPRGEEWRTTLHHSSPTLHLDIFSSDYAELTEHSCSTDYAQNWNGSSTYSVCRITQIFQVKSGWRVVVSGSGWRVVKSGEESSALFTLPKQLIHKHLRHSGEGWRVLLKVACSFDGFAIRRIKRFDLSNLGICNPPCRKRFTSF